MKIVILTQYFQPEMGAPQNRLYDLAEGLRRLGWEVCIVTALPNYPTGRIFQAYRKKFRVREDLNGIEILRYWLYASNSTRAFPRIISMLSFSFTSLFSVFYIRSKRPDYVMVESPPLTLAVSGWLMSVFCRAKMIMNVSDLWPLSARVLGAIQEGWVYRMLVKLEHFLYRRSFLCTGQSQEIVDHIRKIVPKVLLFRNGVETSRFADGRYDPAKRYCLVYAGLLGVAQGILAICEQINFKELGVEFHIYGSGAEQHRLENYLRDHSDRGIIYQGAISRDAIPSVLSSYGGALIALVKNIYGAVPSKIYEALAAGLPIVFSGEGEGAAIIRECRGGWVNHGSDWPALRENIRTFGRMEPGAYLEMRERNSLTAKSQFDRGGELNKLHTWLNSGKGVDAPSRIKANE